MSHSGTHKSPARDNNTEVSGARTLPESLTTSHKGLATFKTELNAALVGDQQKLTYASVKVLLLNWELQDLGKVIFEETKELEAVFTDFYGFATETYCIPGQLAGRNLQLKLIQVLLEVEGGGPGGAKLLIVYYNGYGSMEKDGRLFWTAYVLKLLVTLFDDSPFFVNANTAIGKSVGTRQITTTQNGLLFCGTTSRGCWKLQTWMYFSSSTVAMPLTQPQKVVCQARRKSLQEVLGRS